MDYLRSHHIRDARIYLDDGTPVKIRWFRCLPGAKEFPFPHAFGSSVWDTDLPPNQGVGETGGPIVWSTSVNPGYRGLTFRGKPEWFLDGMPVAELSQPAPPLCAKCFYPMVRDVIPAGGGAWDGAADLARGQAVVAEGGWEQDGRAGINADDTVLGEGGWEQDGVAGFQADWNVLGEGGWEQDGGADLARSYHWSMVWGIVFGEAADISWGQAVLGAGGQLWGLQGGFQPPRVVGLGGQLLDGSASWGQRHVDASGGQLLDGAADVGALWESAGGGLDFAGAAGFLGDGFVAAGLYSTGFDAAGVILNASSCEDDGNYETGGLPAPCPDDTTVAGTGGWLPNDSNSRWIAQACDAAASLGTYAYLLTFDIPVSVDASKVILRGRWSVDDDGLDIVVNAVSTGNTYTTGGAGGDHWEYFLLEGVFVVGTNQIELVTEQAIILPHGLRVEFTSHVVAP